VLRFRQKWICHCSVKYLKNNYKIHKFRNLFSPNEIQKLNLALENNTEFWNHAFTLRDSENSQMAFDQSQWNDPGEDIFGRTAGNAKTVGVAEKVCLRINNILTFFVATQSRRTVHVQRQGDH
jgi:hypothetical protein